MRCSIKELLRGDGVLPFSCELDPAELEFPSILRYESPLTAKGTIRSSAGLLTLTGETRVSLRCICDRCGCEFESVKVTPLDAVIVEENTGDDPELFTLEGDGIDLSEVLETCFILDMETKFLCKEDCKGLCPTCGKNLNLGPCGCRKQIDPRFAVLEQLVDKK